jgi:hypothetical protein
MGSPGTAGRQRRGPANGSRGAQPSGDPPDCVVDGLVALQHAPVLLQQAQADLQGRVWSVALSAAHVVPLPTPPSTPCVHAS